MIAEVMAAKTPEDFFGDDVQGRYKEAAKALHPDLNKEDGAEEAFKRLQQLFEAAVKAQAKGVYGKRNAVVDEVLIQTRRRAYKLTDLVTQGDSCNLYRASFEREGIPTEGFVKIVRNAADNDLMTNEAKQLKHMLSNKDLFDDFSPYLPSYIETFGYRPGGKGKARQATAFSKEWDLVTLEDVRRVYAQGVHPKDMAWMFRRLLMALGFAHETGVIHGAVLPCHVLLQPQMHGLVLVDWKAATQGEKIKTITSRYKSMYPEEVLEKEKPSNGTDIIMAVRCMEYVIGEQPVPKQLKAFFRGCSQANHKRRPQDAHGLKDEFDELIERLWGPRRFRPFAMRTAA